LGEPLFERRGRKLVLTPAGRDFLDAVRDSIRRVDDGVSWVTSGELAGSVYLLSTSSIVDAVLIPALCTLRRQYPKLIAHLHRLSAEDVFHRILGGQLDIAFLLGSASHRGLTIDQLGCASSGIYCGPEHPFFGSTDISLARLVEQTFVVIASPGTENACDGWPGDQPRKIGLCVSDANVACQLCQHGDMLAALPDAVVRLYGFNGRLYRLPLNLLAETPICSVRRPALSPHSSSEAVIRVVKKQIEAMRPFGIRLPDRSSFSNQQYENF
jgi:DNA-binding transcriptional LysR family regulator